MPAAVFAAGWFAHRRPESLIAQSVQAVPHAGEPARLSVRTAARTRGSPEAIAHQIALAGRANLGRALERLPKATRDAAVLEVTEAQQPYISVAQDYPPAPST